jgi:hypothetical protein
VSALSKQQEASKNAVKGQAQPNQPLHSPPRGITALDVIPANQAIFMLRVWHQPEDKDQCCGHSADALDPARRFGRWHRLIACQPRTPVRHIICRYTRGYIAVDIDAKRLVWLKDAWRLSLPDIPKEIATYKRLHIALDLNRENLPSFLFRDDDCVDPEGLSLCRRRRRRMPSRRPAPTSTGATSTEVCQRRRIRCVTSCWSHTPITALSSEKLGATCPPST